MLKTVLAKLLTLKVGAVAAAVTATGGVALAAANGALPNPLASPSAKPLAYATGQPSAPGEQVQGSAGKGTPSPSLVGLCRAYQAGAGNNPGKVLENPAFTVLINTAGGKEEVATYCDELLADEKAKPESATSARPTSHPTGKPASVPSPAATKPSQAGDDRRPDVPTPSPAS